MVTRSSQIDHDTMVNYVVAALVKDHFEDIKADLPGYEEPDPIEWAQTGVGHVPDVTAVKEGRLHLYEVETIDTVSGPDTENQWQLFASFADRHGAKFIIVVPSGGSAQAAGEQVAHLGIRADIWPVKAP